jgi:S-adenosyl-L-methionine hydrolase (adenosine-forming)
LEPFTVNDKTVEGKILFIDGFGNIITNINGMRIKNYFDFGKKIMVFIGKKRIEVPFVKTYGEIKKGKTLAPIGSSNLFEIQKNRPI